MSESSLGELSGQVLLDFYTQDPGLGCNTVDSGPYELRLLSNSLVELQEKLSAFVRCDPLDLPSGVAAQACSDLLALASELEWAVGVASTASGSRQRSQRRQQRKYDRGEL